MHLLNRPLVHIASIVLVVFIIYSNTFTAPFEFDDPSNIADNHAIRDLHNFVDTSHFEKIEISETLRPLLKTRYIGYLSFALNYAVHGLDVRGYHIVNILIHIANSLLLYLLLQLTFRTPAFHNKSTGEPGAFSVDSRSFVAVFTTLLFAVHPIQTQAVTYIVQRFASLAALFYLLSLVAYIRFRLEDSASAVRRYAFYGLSLASTVLAMKTKEFALLLPIVIALYEFTFFAGGLKKRIINLVPYALTLSIIPLSMLSVSAINVSGANGHVSRINYLLTQFRVIVTYLRLLIFPVDQNVDYDYPVYRFFLVPEVLLSFLFLLLVLAIGTWLFWISRDLNRKNSHWLRLAACGIFWFFITAAPESSIIPIKDVIFEHRMYLPSIGLFLTATITIELLFSRWGNKLLSVRKLSVSLMAILIVILSATTYARNNIWKDSVRLWEDIVKKSPNKPGAVYNLGNAYADQGRVKDAIDAYKAAIRITRVFSIDVYNNLGVALMAQGQVDEAISAYEHASRIATMDGEIHFNLASAYLVKGRIDDAISEFEASIQCRPGEAMFHYHLGAAYAKQGQFDKAINEYATAIRLNPDNVGTRNNLGNIFNSVGRIEEAINEYQAALKIKPDFAEAHYNLGNSFAKLGRMDEAKYEYREALRLKPDFIEARRNLEK